MSEFYDNEFERFLQQQVKQHRMYPSDAVWKGIYKQIHGNKKWPGLYFVAILIVAALSVCTIFMESSPIVYPQQTVAATSPLPVVDQLDPRQLTKQTFQSIEKDQVQNPGVLTEPIALAEETPAPENRFYTIDNDISENNPGLVTADDPLISQRPEEITVSSTQQTELTEKQSAGLSKDKNIEESTKAITEEPVKAGEEAQIPVIASKAKTSKWQYEVYITPATNFKKTVDRKPAMDQFNGPMVTTYGVSANQVIRYKPGMGIEFGMGALYNASKRVTLKAGLQYNVRQYNIEAYAGSYELASISLVSGGSVNKVPTVAKYRSYGANNNDALLLNKYHQVSLPVGLEYAVISNNRFGINIAGTVQPTYTFSQSAYLLTSDYKSYADGTSMLRRWNINSAFEASFNVKVGDFQWKFGPQIRYQHLSTYTSKYPIKEYLIDYGFKIGFTKTIH